MKLLEDMTESELRELMQALGNQIVAVCAVMEVEKPLFTLVLFNDPKLGQYVSSCCREDMVKCLHETVNRLEKNEDVPR